jgi:hypothetical protein
LSVYRVFTALYDQTVVNEAKLRGTLQKRIGNIARYCSSSNPAAHSRTKKTFNPAL